MNGAMSLPSSKAKHTKSEIIAAADISHNAAITFLCIEAVKREIVFQCGILGRKKCAR